ncbi:MAG TPA: polysaccharide deacetylase family protein [Bacteroidia bacterium]|nr:polysaccharide deacetylase family protein [Bacteroidia bacterium]
MVLQRLLSSVFPDLIFRINTSEKVLYLTFDDGPTEITPWVLEELKKFNAVATFFCIGSNVEKYPELYSEIISQSHSVGNHTMHHLNGWKTKTEKYIEDVDRCNSLLDHFQFSTNYFRPPYGRITPSQYSSLKKNYRIAMWDVLSKDYDEKVSEEKCLERVITKSKPGSIVVFHDSIKAEKNLRYVLPRVLEYFSEIHFSFETLEQQ